MTGKNRYVTFALILLAFSGFLLSGIVYSIIILSTSLNMEQNLDEANYEFFKRNYRSNESFSGIIKFPHSLQKGVTFSTGNEKLSETFILPYGSDEYECVGSCYCEDNIIESEERRVLSSSPILLKRGIVFVLMAVSSRIAYERAKEYFREECAERFSDDTCHASSIVVELDSCQSTEELPADDSQTKELKKKEDYRSYFCYGNCVRFMDIRYTEEARRIAEGFHCEGLKQEGFVTVFESEIPDTKTVRTQSQKFATKARQKFQTNHLIDFCKKNSAVEYEYKYKRRRNYGKSGRTVEYDRTKRKSVSVCVGVHKDSKANSWCRQTDPKPQRTNNRFWERKKEWDDGWRKN